MRDFLIKLSLVSVIVIIIGAIGVAFPFIVVPAIGLYVAWFLLSVLAQMWR